MLISTIDKIREENEGISHELIMRYVKFGINEYVQIFEKLKYDKEKYEDKILNYSNYLETKGINPDDDKILSLLLDIYNEILQKIETLKTLKQQQTFTNTLLQTGEVEFDNLSFEKANKDFKFKQKLEQIEFLYRMDFKKLGVTEQKLNEMRDKELTKIISSFNEYEANRYKTYDKLFKKELVLKLKQKH